MSDNHVYTASEAEAHLKAGRKLYVPTYTRCVVYTLKDWEAWAKVGKPLLWDAKDGGIWQAGRKRPTYLMRGQLHVMQEAS